MIIELKKISKRLKDLRHQFLSIDCLQHKPYIKNIWDSSERIFLRSEKLENQIFKACNFPIKSTINKYKLLMILSHSHLN